MNHGKGRFKTDVVGKCNTITVAKGAFVYKPFVKIRGNNNQIVITSGCQIRNNVGFQIDGSNLTILIGTNTTVQHGTRFHAQGANISIGEDCMLSNNVFIRTSDSHPIYDESNKRINPPLPVTIGNHVWLAASARIFKGAIVGDGSVIGAYSLVTKTIPSHVIAAGIPAKIVKENIRWERC